MPVSDAAARRAADWLAAWHRAGLLGTDPEVVGYVADLIQFVGGRTLEKTDDGLVEECLKLIQNVDERLRSVADNPTACEATLADGFTHLFARVRQLECQLAGEKKANALLNAGMGDVCEGRDQLKHRVRELEAEVARLREGLRKLRPFLHAAAVADCDELLGDSQ